VFPFPLDEDKEGPYLLKANKVPVLRLRIAFTVSVIYRIS